ncbi:MAG: DUF4150 domain-containing protein [Polyangiaceae bacterium]|nr:DUF4150 domain-containing protein [Polyangiaceae bacterium]
MLPASNKGPSLNFGFPDVCRTPIGPLIIPIPYPNFAAHAMAIPFSPVVSAAMIPALNLASVVPLTTGDEPGVAHWTVMGPGTFDMGNPVVFIDMLPGINLTCPTSGNTCNDEPGMVVAPGAPNVLYTFAPAADPQSRERRLDNVELGAFDALLEGPPTGDERLLSEAVGYLRVCVFSWRLPAAVDAAVVRLIGQGARALVMDLRGCPGGELRVLTELAGDFLERGDHIVTEIEADGTESTHRARREPAHTLPVALLVDGGTASAAELFAGALQAHGRAVVIGEPTYGKHTGQVLARVQDGAVARNAALLQPPGSASNREDSKVIPDQAATNECAIEAASQVLERVLHLHQKEGSQ